MTDAGSIREGKPSRLRSQGGEDGPLAGLTGGLRERRQVRAEPRPAPPGAEGGAQRRSWWRRTFRRDSS
jgi:hypothetical protein